MKLCFLTNVYDEWALAERSLRTLRSFYPDASFIVCSDGGDNAEFRKFCQELGVEFFVGYRLKLLDNGAAWVVRQLTAFSKHPDHDFFIKFDPDSLFLRRFQSFPQGDLFGSLRSNRRSQYVQGGCLGMPWKTVQALLKCTFWNNPAYSTTRFGYQRYQPPYLAAGEKPTGDWFVSGDVVLSDVARILQLRFDEWEDCCCFTHRYELDRVLLGLSIEEIRALYAVIHPCKTLDLAETPHGF